jgi:hypothetical protein
MKRLVLIISILLSVPAFAATQGKTVSKAGITSVINECRSIEGAELVSLGRVATAALKVTLRTAAIGNRDAREALSVMKGIKGITVLDFEDCSVSDKARISRKLGRTLSGSEMLMEANDGGDKMMIYGVVDEKSGTVGDFILYSPSDCALVCLFGTISMEAVAKLASDD